MFKSINLSTYTLASDSLLIWRFHFTIEDFLLAIRLLSKVNSLLYMLTYLVCGSSSHFNPTYTQVKTEREHTEQLMVKKHLKKNPDCLISSSSRGSVGSVVSWGLTSKWTNLPGLAVYVRLSSYTLQVLLLWDDWRGWEELVGHAHRLQTAWSCEEKHWLVTKSNILIYVYLLTHTHICIFIFIYLHIYTPTTSYTPT